MRIHFNQAITGNRYNYRSTNTSALYTAASFSNAPKTNLDLPQVNPAYFSNISLKIKTYKEKLYLLIKI